MSENGFEQGFSDGYRKAESEHAEKTAYANAKFEALRQGMLTFFAELQSPDVQWVTLHAALAPMIVESRHAEALANVIRCHPGFNGYRWPNMAHMTAEEVQDAILEWEVKARAALAAWEKEGR